MTESKKILNDKFMISTVLEKEENIRDYLEYVAAQDRNYEICYVKTRAKKEYKDLLTNYALLKKNPVKDFQKITDIYSDEETGRIFLFVKSESRKSLKNLIEENGSLQRKDCLKKSKEITDILQELYLSVPDARMREVRLNQIYIQKNGRILLKGIEKLRMREEIGKHAEAKGTIACDLGAIFYYMAAGYQKELTSKEISKLLEQQELSSVVGKHYVKTIKKCVLNKYEDKTVPFRKIRWDLFKTGLLDLFVSGNNRYVTKALPEKTFQNMRVKGHVATSGISASGSDQLIHSVTGIAYGGTERLDKPPGWAEEIQNVNDRVPKDLFGKFVIVRSEVWIHTEEMIRYADTTGREN